MIKGLLRALRFARAWKGSGGGLREEELEIPGEGGAVSATLLRPSRSAALLPGWVALHGVTRPGRAHPTLVRFARALARSGAVVLIPQVEAWRQLHLAPREAQCTLRSAVRFLSDHEGVASGGVGAMGFSFGVPRVLEAGSDPELRGRLRSVTGFGGYGDLERTLRFLFTGKHEWRGTLHHGHPDPYGRWIVGANLLTRIPEHADAGDVAEALLTLAREAGDAQVEAWSPSYDARMAELETSVAPSRRALFRLFAPPSGALPTPEPAAELARALARVALERPEDYDPTQHLPSLQVPVHLMHGREDRLIPFTESLRLAASFPPDAPRTVAITGLFSHSRRDGRGPLHREVSERMRLLRALGRSLGSA